LGGLRSKKSDDLLQGKTKDEGKHYFERTNTGSKKGVTGETPLYCSVRGCGRVFGKGIVGVEFRRSRFAGHLHEETVERDILPGGTRAGLPPSR